MVSDGTVEVLEGFDGGSNRKEAEAIEVDDGCCIGGCGACGESGQRRKHLEE